MAVPPLTRNKIQLVLRAEKTKTDNVHRQKVTKTVHKSSTLTSE